MKSEPSRQSLTEHPADRHVSQNQRVVDGQRVCLKLRSSVPSRDRHSQAQVFYYLRPLLNAIGTLRTDSGTGGYDLAIIVTAHL
jgi:hypothetical protein